MSFLKLKTQKLMKKENDKGVKIVIRLLLISIVLFMLISCSIAGNPNSSNKKEKPDYKYDMTTNEGLSEAMADLAFVNEILNSQEKAVGQTTKILGDVNGDSQINIVDALMTARYGVGIIDEGFNPDNADVNGDGIINIVDALLISQYDAGLITSFPAEELIYPSLSTCIQYNNPGTDGVWFTTDDVPVTYEIRDYQSYQDENTVKNYGVGLDGVIYTQDDVVFGWFHNNNAAGGTWHTNPGADNIWFNEDDYIETIETWETEDKNIICGDPGTDGIWFTSDDIILSYAANVNDADGNLIRRVNYSEPGADGIWFTADDVIGVTWYGAYYVNEYEGENNRWWSWSKQIRYNGPGPDGIWLNEDDDVMDFRVHEFDDNTKFYTKELIYNNPGTDGIMFTGDDILSGYFTGDNVY